MSICMRLQAARKAMAEQAIDCLIVTPSSDLFYLTGHRGFLMERPIFLALLQDKAYYVAPAFEIDGLDEAFLSQIECVPWKENESPYQKFKTIIGNAAKKVAMEDSAPSFIYHSLRANFPLWDWVLASNILTPLRRCKDANELDFHHVAQCMTGRALRRFLSEGIVNMTEIAAARKLKNYLCEEGLDASLPIVAAGPGGAAAHHHTDETVISVGDVVVIDCGGAYQGYYSDMTRTVFAGKNPTEFQKKIYEIVKQANQAAYEAIRPNVSCESVDNAGRELIEKAGYGQYFTHRLGHGIGLDVHEEPYMVKGNQTLLEPGNVFSDEPGIYLPNQFGIRIEDLVAVTADGAWRLGDMGRDLLVVD